MKDNATTYKNAATLRKGGLRRGWSLSIEQIGTMTLPDGRLSAGDPSQNLFGNGLPPMLTLQAEPGAYPLEVSFAEKRGDRRIAAVLLNLSTSDLVSWEKVSLSDNGSSPAFGYEIAVDSAHAYLAAFTAARLIASSGASLVDIATRGQRGESFDWGEVPTPNAGNLFFFSTGMGDGSYPLFLGRDGAGLPVVLIVDFLMIGKP